MSEQVLNVMIGLPGSGKSTIAKNLNAIWLSSDFARGVFGAGEHDQKISGKVFTFLEDSAKYLLAMGQSVTIDATNIRAKDRAVFVSIASNIGVKSIAWWVNTDLFECKRRNNNRLRKVPEHVIDNMSARFQEPLIIEGFAEIKKLVG